MLPGLTSSKFCERWIIAIVVCSAIGAFDGGALTHWLALTPIKVLHGQVWRLATWPLVETGPFSLILTCIAIVKLADPIATAWGDGRLQRFVTHIALGSGIAAVVFAAVAGARHISYLGGWAMSTALVIAYARQFPYRSLRVYGISFGGERLVGMIALISVAYAIFGGAVAMAPELAACGIAVWYPRELLARK